jgi:chromosome segregation ATPase
VKNGFEASVPARKPKTQIGRVLTELTSASAAPLIEVIDEDAPLQNGHDGAHSSGGFPVDETAAARPRNAPDTAASARGPIALHQDATSGVSNEWERLAALRERLAAAAQPRSGASEPQHTAAAVRKHIEVLRARLEAAARERSELASTLENTRSALARAEAELNHERSIRGHIEAQADEREKVAVQAVAEAEALASERDLVLSELAERRRLEQEQQWLLADAEATIQRHRTDNEVVARELADLRELLDLRSAEVADLENRLQAEKAERIRVESRARELEAQITRLTETADALEALRELVGPGALR